MAVKIIETVNVEREYRNNIENKIKKIVGNRLTLSMEEYDFRDDRHISDIFDYKGSENDVSICFNDIKNILIDNGFDIVRDSHQGRILNFERNDNGYKYRIELQNNFDYLSFIFDKGKRIRSNDKKFPNGYDEISGDIAIYYTQLKNIYNSILKGLGVTEDELLSIDMDEVDDYQSNLGFGGIMNGIPDSSSEIERNSEEGEFDGGIVIPDMKFCIGFVAAACEKNEYGEYDMTYPYPVVWVSTAGKYRNVIKDAVTGTAFKIKKLD